MSKKQFSLSERVRSFKYALNGLRILFKEEHNARVHLFFALSAIIAGYLLSISLLEWISILIAIGLVFSLELINSSIESLADYISPERNEQIKKVKDLAAAGVLIASLTALCIGIIIFLPKVLTLLIDFKN